MKTFIKTLLIFVFVIGLFSCDKQNANILEDTTWEDQSKTISFTFTDSYCECNFNDNSNAKAVYSYECDDASINLYIASSTGYSNLEGIISKKYITLKPTTNGNESDSTSMVLLPIDKEVKFYKK